MRGGRARVLTKDDVAQIAAAYHHYRDVEGERVNIAGFSKTTTPDQVRANDYKLTPGIYVGTEAQANDETPFEVRRTELTAQLKQQFAESNALQEKIVRELDRVIG